MRLPIVIGRRQYRHWPGSKIRLEKQLLFRRAVAVPAPAEVVGFNKLPTYSDQARSALRAGCELLGLQGIPGTQRRARVRNSLMSANRNPINGLVILPFEGMPTPIVQTLAGKVEEHGISTRIELPVPLPDAAFAPQRGQYRAESLLALVRGHGAPHVLGLGHCENARCVMYFSNSLADTDLKSEVYCNRCAAQLRAARRPKRRHKRAR